MGKPAWAPGIPSGFQECCPCMYTQAWTGEGGPGMRGHAFVLLFCAPKRKHGHRCLVQRPCPKGCCLAAGKVGTNPNENDEMTQTQRTLQLLKQATSTIITHFISEEQELQKGLTCPMSTARFELGLEPTSSESQGPLISSAQILSTVQQVLKTTIVTIMIPKASLH